MFKKIFTPYQKNAFNPALTRNTFGMGVILLSIIFLTACTHQPVKPDPVDTQPSVTINNHKITVEIVDTPQTRAQGLSDRQSLAKDHGMLFVFDSYAQYSFWMKDMHFPIDIIWIKDDIIVDISKNVPVPSVEPLEHYTPSQAINYVLEVNANYADQNDIKIGDRINGLDLI